MQEIDSARSSRFITAVDPQEISDPRDNPGSTSGLICPTDSDDAELLREELLTSPASLKMQPGISSATKSIATARTYFCCVLLISQ